MKKIISILFLVFTGCIFRGNSTASARIENISGEEITAMEINIANETYHFKNVQPFEFVNVRTKIPFESSYTIIVTFKSGTKLKGNVGYVTADGYQFDDIILISTNNIILGNREINPK